MVKAGKMPKPKQLAGRRQAWDVRAQDRAVDNLPTVGGDDASDDTWSMLMPRKLPLHVERNFVKRHAYLSFPTGKGPRVRLPDDPESDEFRAA
jgi:hypothetical protein